MPFLYQQLESTETCLAVRCKPTREEHKYIPGEKWSFSCSPGCIPILTSTDLLLSALRLSPLFPYGLFPGEEWEEEALDEFDRLTHCADWKPLVAKISSYVQTGISTWPKVYLYDTSNGKVRVRSYTAYCIVHIFSLRNP